MDEMFVIEYPDSGLMKFEAFGSEEEAREKVLDLFNHGKKYGVKLHRCIIKTTYNTELSVSYTKVEVKCGKN